MSAAPQLESTGTAAIGAPVELGKASIASRAIQVLFGSVVAANVLSMSLMNFFESATSNTALVYAGCLAATTPLLLTRHLPRLPALTRIEHLLCLGLGLALFLPRFGYLIEGLLGYSVNIVCWDDTNHLQEMSSIVHSAHFPPRATYDTSQYLTYYYAPWMLGAALYWSGIASTVKLAFGLTYLLHSFFFVYGAMYASRVLFSEQRLQNLFLASCLLYGGFDFLYWLFNFTLPPPYPEWWALNFGIGIHYSSFVTLATWVQHHTLSALTILYGLFLTIRAKHSMIHALAGVLYLSATFSSIFTIIGAAPIVAWFFLRHKLLNAAVPAAFSFLLFSLPLWWILLGRSETAQFEIFGTLYPFWQDHKKEAFLIFLLLLSLELMPLIALAFAAVRKQRDFSHSILFSLCIVFLLSTFFLSSSIGNNYMRQGSILPIFALTYLATPALSEWLKNSRHVWTYFVIASYSLGGALGYSSLWHSALLAYSKSNTNLNAEILQHNDGTSDLTSAEILSRGGANAWLLMERERPAENPVGFHHVATMNSDNRYRITASRLLGSQEASGPSE